ncbi:hypothetical protein PV682_34215 [Streptomyces niveiscabiei]|uniref:hypothetical protein n=1 Tax=Streptomyces niveiscabiei TaxID=164115 RepID=UPI0029A882C3|nr:hypothetical protein [Streptomyces niveiscabiei]MDX3386470.1 hypothetical protein [Streptomyces niveiscabiei]
MPTTDQLRTTADFLTAFAAQLPDGHEPFDGFGVMRLTRDAERLLLTGRNLLGDLRTALCHPETDPRITLACVAAVPKIGDAFTALGDAAVPAVHSRLPGTGEPDESRVPLYLEAARKSLTDAATGLRRAADAVDAPDDGRTRAALTRTTPAVRPSSATAPAPPATPSPPVPRTTRSL